MNKSILGASAAISLAVAIAVPAGAATLVPAIQTTLTDLGTFAAGSYQITATGVISLAGTAGDGGFDLGPDGRPVTPVTIAGYTYFNPNGSPLDIPGGNLVGPAGPTVNLGALVGTLTASPTVSDYFLIGYGTTVTLGSAGNIYALVNDTFYPNDSGAFSVEVTRVVDPIPEPATWALLIGGFGLIGAAMRRRAAIGRAAPFRTSTW